MKYSPGDRVIIVDGIDAKNRSHIGRVCAVEAFFPYDPLRPPHNHGIILPFDFYIVDFSTLTEKPCGCISADFAYRERDLKPYYDGMEKGSWDESVWAPKEVVA